MAAGHRCARTFAQGGTFWGRRPQQGGRYGLQSSEQRPERSELQRVGPFDQVGGAHLARRHVAGAHRGSRARMPSAATTNLLQLHRGSSSRAATRRPTAPQLGRRPGEDVRERARPQHLPHERLRGDSARARCLAGEDEGIVQHASSFACNGQRDHRLRNSNVCNNGEQAGVVGLLQPRLRPREPFRRARRQRLRHAKQVPGGILDVQRLAVRANTTVQSSMDVGAARERAYLGWTDRRGTPVGWRRPPLAASSSCSWRRSSDGGRAKRARRRRRRDGEPRASGAPPSPAAPAPAARTPSNVIVPYWRPRP